MHIQRQNEAFAYRLAADLTKKFVNDLHREFKEWHKTRPDRKRGDWMQNMGVRGWPNVERFLEDRYPESCRGLDMGIEQAQEVMEGRGKRWSYPYETGPEAEAQYGYDPKAVAAGMLILHHTKNNASGRYYQIGYDENLLADIFQKRMKMQKDYEERQRKLLNANTIRCAAPEYMSDEWYQADDYAPYDDTNDGFSEPIQQLTDRLRKEFTDWATPVVESTKWGGPSDAWKPKPEELASEWPYVEQFLKERYPAAHQGLDDGREGALPVAKETPYAMSQGLGYETGPDAVAKVRL
ncbi:MAG: hypothetical protein E6Q61_06265 [Nitrosomonas sp.]|nr:MAG: hypothetical protein E6Q61_06265 [Nitrosomonas sp.]